MLQGPRYDSQPTTRNPQPTMTLQTKPSPPSTQSRPQPRERFQILVTCADEADQRRLYERLAREGRACRVLVV